MAFTVEKEWQTKAGYAAVCIAIKEMHRCGYVGIPKNHPLHGADYSKPTAKLKDMWEKVKNGPIGKRGVISLVAASLETDENEKLTPSLIFNVHGGITYSGGKDYPVPNKNGLWWFGFDCGHSGDGYMEGSYRSWTSGSVRTVEYVMAECESLAEQLKEIVP